MAAVIRNALTVDVEEYFQVAAFERTIPRVSWDGTKSRVEVNTGQVLDMFGRRGVKATFFVLGWIAEDELVEVTPKSIRLRKKALEQTARYKMERDRKKGASA